MEYKSKNDFLRAGLHPLKYPVEDMLSSFGKSLKENPDSYDYYVSLPDIEKKKIIDFIRTNDEGKSIDNNIDYAVHNIKNTDFDFLNN